MISEKKALTLKEIQDIELKLLLGFDEVCSSLGLRYSLGGGSLLGAVRHKGFIPWDDDIDVMMPRPDYDAFLNYCKNSKLEFETITYDTVEGYNSLFARVSDLNTIIKDELMDMPFEMGVGIDIFPIDGLGKTEKKAKNIFYRTYLKREILNATGWRRFFRSRTHSVLVEPVRFSLFVLSRFVDPKQLLKKIDKENHRHSFDGSVYAGCVCGSYREREIMKTDTFTNYCELDFEGHKIKAINNYDEYLTKHYGDYMKLPPVEKQKTHHTYKAYKK